MLCIMRIGPLYKYLVVVITLFSLPCYGDDYNEVNDLNRVLRYVIGEMHADNFFQSLWFEFFGISDTNIRNVCGAARPINITNADKSLTNVVESGILRVGLVSIFTGIPILYAVEPVSNKTNSTMEESSEEVTKTTDLTRGDPDGYEIRCVKEAARRLSLIYENEIRLEYVLVDQFLNAEFTEIGIDQFFDAVVSGLNEDKFDVAWTDLWIFETRNKYVDYVCSTVFRELIVVSDGIVPKETPDPDGEPIKVACRGIDCDIQAPKPFVLVEVDISFEQYRNIDFADGEIHCVIDKKEEFFYPNRSCCPGCHMVGDSAIAETLGGPATRQIIPVNISSKPDQPKEDASASMKFSYGPISVSIISLLWLIQ